ncbi:unnamed protein product [Closterium sp. NIES-54]
MAPGQQASAGDMVVEGGEDEEEEGLEAPTTMEAANMAAMAMTTRATDAVTDGWTASVLFSTRADTCGAIATNSLMDGLLLKAKRAEEQGEGEEEAVEAVTVVRIRKVSGSNPSVCTSGIPVRGGVRGPLWSSDWDSDMVFGAEDVGAASASGKRRSSKAKGGRGGGCGSGGGGGGSSVGGGGSGGGGGGGSGGGSGGFGGGSGGSGSGGGRAGATQRGGFGGGPRQQQERRSETPSPQHLREWFSQRGSSGGSGSCPYVIRTGDRAGQTCGKPHTQYRYFSRLDDAWRTEFDDEAERPRWAELLRSRVAIFDLDYDAILAPMYALSAAALGASESDLPGTAPVEAFHTFTLDSGASRCFFRESTTLTPLSAPVSIRLADPPGGPDVARSSTVLPCPAVPSGSLSGLHLPSFSSNLVSTAALQDAMVTTTTRGGPVAPPCSCRLLSCQTLLWNHRLGHPSLPRLRGMHTRLLVSGLPSSLPPLPPSPAPPCLPCV